MANENNLIPIKTTEDARQKGSNGGKKSAEVKRQRKAMKEQMELLLSLPCKDKKAINFMENLGIDNDIDNQMALMVTLYGRALKGNMVAIQEIRKIIRDDQNESTSEDRVQIINDLPNKDDEDDKNAES